MFYESFTFWLISAVLIFTGIALRVPFVNKILVAPLMKVFKGRLTAAVVVLVIGMFITGMGFGNIFGIASSVGSVGASDYYVATYSLPAGSGVGTSGTIAQDTSRTDMVTLRMTDAQSYGSIADLNSTSIVIERKDCSKAGSLTVTAHTVDFNSPSDASDTVKYNILDKNAAGEKLIYFGTSAVTTNSQKEKIELGFAEGTCSATLHTGFELSEAGTDELNIYDVRTITLFGNGKRLTTIEYMDLDAAA